MSIYRVSFAIFANFETWFGVSSKGSDRTYLSKGVAGFLFIRLAGSREEGFWIKWLNDKLANESGKRTAKFSNPGGFL